MCAKTVERVKAEPTIHMPCVWIVLCKIYRDFMKPLFINVCCVLYTGGYRDRCPHSGGIPQPRPMVLGHEFMGIVEETGNSVTHLKKGDRVVVPFPIACGYCFFCEHELPGHCEHSNPKHYGPEGGLLTEKGGALFGYTDLYGGYDGGQAQYVRVPYGDVGPRKVPDNLTDEQVLFLTDIFPTGYTGVDWAGVKGGESVAIFGAGPVGIMAAKSAWLRGAGRVLIVGLQAVESGNLRQL